MRLYSGSSSNFIRDSTHNRIAEILKSAFRAHFRYDPPNSEVNSWRNSLRSLAQVFTEASLNDHGVMLEYQLPLTSRRLDCMVTGLDIDRESSAVIVELKQWDGCETSETDDLVRSYVGGGVRELLHPSVQANQYRRYLADMHEAFYGDGAVKLTACAYLHNYLPIADDPILATKFDSIRALVPLFTGDRVPQLVEYLGSRLLNGGGQVVLERVENSRFRPSKRLLDHVSGVIQREPRFVLLDEQQVVFQRVLASVRGGLSDHKKRMFLIHGGPGTGKSVLAINLMSTLSTMGLNAQYATGSRAFTQTLHKIVGRRASAQFKYFHNYGEAQPNDVDVLICDEAHRIRQNSNNRFKVATKRTTRPQVAEIVDASKVSVFFIDDRQVVRPGEVGSSSMLREFAQQHGHSIEEHKLEAQFRCAGSAAFINWVNNTLGVEETSTPIWNQREETFELRIVGSPEELEQAIRTKQDEGATARMTAGFCWPWAKQTMPDGSLVNDVVIGDFKRPWNARSELRGLRAGIPPEVLWAFDPRGIDQIGCVYTAQGFEFDYVGVIWGNDLVYNPDSSTWIGQREFSKDQVVRRSSEQFVDLVKNTYRVLLTRGLKGCYVHFMNKDTERFVRSRAEYLNERPAQVVPIATPTAVQRQASALVAANEESPRRFAVLPASQVRPYVNSIPLVDLKLAAGAFSAPQSFDPDEVEWVSPPEFVAPGQGLFIAQVVGESMNRRIPNGSWCLFRLDPGGTKQGMIVVAQHRSIADPDLGGQYTVKVYSSVKRTNEDGEWRHASVTLRPDSTDTSYPAIEIDENKAGPVRIIANLVSILP